MIETIGYLHPAPSPPNETTVNAIPPPTLLRALIPVLLLPLSSASAAVSLIGSQLSLRTFGQDTPSSTPIITSFPMSSVVGHPKIEFPDVSSYFNPESGVPPGTYLVNVSIDAGADFLSIDFDEAGFGNFNAGYQNTYVFTFEAATALEITAVSIDGPTNTLGMTADRVTFAGNELFVNVQALSFSPSSFVRINLNAVPEPSTLWITTSGALGLAFRRKRRIRCEVG